MVDVHSAGLAPTGSRTNGVVKFFSEDKGYGFITPDEGGRDIYVHRTGLVDVDKDDAGRPTLFENQRVSYTAVQSDKKKGDGRMATAVNVED
jgi:cold shock protein